MTTNVLRQEIVDWLASLPLEDCIEAMAKAGRIRWEDREIVLCVFRKRDEEILDLLRAERSHRENQALTRVGDGT